MKKINVLSLLLILTFAACLLFPACSREEHFLKDPAYRKLVHRQFLKRAELARGRQQELFSVMNGLKTEEREALEFLYAFMPLSDLANLDGNYFLQQVRTALEARSYFPWGKSIPDEIFRHFVLPYRVNNENPDPARQIFFEELKNRIKDLDMYRAALEVNHWCHEKVTYRPTDERTSAPLATVRTAFGRCGEESTFTVAALRAVSIPARQVYTPRWAHTDDNHAWVEVWVNGRWYYLGACEPEPELNMGWFTGPAKRAMLVHTTVFGQYTGPEEVLERTELYTKINQLPMYAPTARLLVEVNDTSGKPVPEATVEFCLYNYAEFYPIAVKLTDKKGRASLITGSGDLMVIARKNGLIAREKVSAGKSDQVKLTLSEPDLTEREEDLDIIPPAERPVEPPDPVKAQENNRRLRLEDIKRAAYESTFIRREIAAIFAREKGLPEEPVWKYLELSRGNWPEILDYLYQLKPEEFQEGLALLGAITEKDLRDTPASILLHHLRESQPRPAEMDEETYIRYVLSPRIGRELLSPWRRYLQEKFPENLKNEFITDPEKIAGWIKNNIMLDSTNYYGVPLLPRGMVELGRGDVYSMKILFVAMARSLGIPARLDRATGRPCYLKNGDWKEIYFGQEKPESGTAEKSTLIIDYEPAPGLPQPTYYSHFTLAQFSQGWYRTLDYENDPAVKSFPLTLRVDPGHYLLISGNRQPDGSVLCRLKFFDVLPGRENRVKFTLRTGFQEPEVIGYLDPEVEVFDLKDQLPVTLSSFIKGRSYILLLIEPDREPTKHLMEELQSLAHYFSSWSGQLAIVVARDTLPPGFGAETYRQLPAAVRLLYDRENRLRESFSRTFNRQSFSLPLAVACRAGNQVIFFSEGYRIGTGDQLVRTLIWLK